MEGCCLCCDVDGAMYRLRLLLVVPLFPFPFWTAGGDATDDEGATAAAAADAPPADAAAAGAVVPPSAEEPAQAAAPDNETRDEAEEW